MLIPIRDENPTQRVPIVTVGLLLANVSVFVYAKLLGPTGFEVFLASIAVVPFEITHIVDAISPTPFPVLLTTVTSMFMHAGWLHIASNMLYLWVFANNVEDVLGRARFLLFYLACGVAAALAQTLTEPESTIPLVGASGAVAGALGGYLVAFPGAYVHVFVPIFFLFRIPAVLVLILWFGLQLLWAWLDEGGAGGTAWYAHIGGFVVGYVVMRHRVSRIRVI